MQRTLVVRCPNCGSFAKRHLFSHHLTHQAKRGSQPQVMRTECPHCDYLMTVCQDEGEIHSVYSPVTTLFSQNQTPPSRKF